MNQVGATGWIQWLTKNGEGQVCGGKWCSSDRLLLGTLFQDSRERPGLRQMMFKSQLQPWYQTKQKIRARMKTGLRIAVILKRQEGEGSVRSRRKGSWEKMASQNSGELKVSRKETQRCHLHGFSHRKLEHNFSQE